VLFSRRCILAGATAVSLLASACFGDRSSGGGRDTRFSGRDSSRTLGPGDVQIASVDSTIEIAIIGDTVITGLGKKVLDEVRQKTDTSTVSGNGFAAGIEKMVKSTVANALGSQLLIPVSSIDDVRYTDGRLQLIGSNGARMRFFDNTRSNGRRVSESFNPDDAERFIRAFRARKAAVR
jgi:hypothetical protein